tara:strand:+ start:53 stop:457 length:405 start_codon:yes stop_codon:yes gene_type:complete
MLKLTKKVEYALISLVHLSEQDNNVFFPASKIAEKYTIPNEILAKILQQLSSLNMIKSIKGPKGGYKISCKINTINMFEFIEMIEGPIGIVDCVASNDCSAIDCCSIKDPMTKINNQIIETLKGITIDQLRQKG